MGNKNNQSHNLPSLPRITAMKNNHPTHTEKKETICAKNL